jgi:hypothetical protein
MIAELSVHQGQFAVLPAAFAVFVPKKSQSHPAFCHLSVHVLAVRQSTHFHFRLLLRKQQILQVTVGLAVNLVPADANLLRSSQHFCHSIPGAVTADRYASLTYAAAF